MDKELLKELIIASAVCIDLLGIDLKEEFPKIFEKFKELEENNDKAR